MDLLERARSASGFSREVRHYDPAYRRHGTSLLARVFSGQNPSVPVRMAGGYRASYSAVVGWPRLMAYATAAAGILAAVLGVVGLAIASSPQRIGWFVVACLAGLSALAVGVLVARHAPDNWVSGLLGLHGACLIAIAGSDAYWAAAQIEPSLPVSAPMASLWIGAWVWLYIPPALLALVFPDGHLTRGARLIAIGLVGVGLAYPLLQAVDPQSYPDPYAAVPHALGTGPSWLRWPGIAMPFLLLALLLGTVIAVFRRYRRATGRQHDQLLWFSLAGLGLPLTLLLCWLSYLLLGSVDLVVIGLGLTGIAVPAAVSIAILRHDLYNVDRAATQAITWTVVLAGLTALFTAVIVLGGLVLGRGSSLVAAAATALCALVLSPLRSRALHAVERRRHPRQAAAMEAVVDLTRRVHAGEAAPEEVQDVLRAELGDPALIVGVRRPNSAALVDIRGEPITEPPACPYPIRLGHQEVGVLLSSSHGSFGPVADAVAMLVELVGLRLELAQALREVTSSRTRLVQAGYDERRRLERDLHDGAQQRLVTLGLSLRLAQRERRAARPRLRAVGAFNAPQADVTDDVDELIDNAVAELTTAVDELRQIAQGLRPSSLDDGLGAALSTLTSRLAPGSRPRVDLNIAADLREAALPDDVATTAYYVVSESLTNALKHADAEHVRVEASRLSNTLRLRVVDDGRGGAMMRPGSGLAGLADRVSAVAGSLQVDSPAGGGTVVEAVLPCGS
jgi:signal transduction histidine kinase